MRLAERVSLAILSQRGHQLGWAPVFLSVGIGTYFGLSREPPQTAYALAMLAGLGLCLLGLAVGPVVRPILVAVAMVAFGFCLVGLRANQVAGPVLTWRYYGPIEGRVIIVDRSQSDAIRLTLDHVVLQDMRAERTPHRVRISMHDADGLPAPTPGMVVATTGHLSPPAGPAEPGGFDFQRMAWFDRLGAVGYTRKPVLVMEPPARGEMQVRLSEIRARLSLAIRSHIAGQPGALAAALVVGDRSGISSKTNADMRAANLSHLLSISGLHMGLLTGFVFAALRTVFALVPALALRLPAKKIAAVASVVAGLVYLYLSGLQVPAQRAFIMVTIVFLAVLFDRRAITLRGVAIAGSLILLLQPESLVEPGFQMSFAATIALVAGFGALQKLPREWSLPAALRPVGGVLATSLVAGMATAPFAAAHFNMVAHYGLIANLICVPLFGAVVMPAAVLAGVLAPLGLAAIPLWVMDMGLRVTLAVSAYVAQLDGAVSHVVSPVPAVIPLLALGGLFLVLWQGQSRLAGLVPIVLGFGLWVTSPRPDLLISDSGGLIGVMTPQGRALSKPRGDGFAASSWLENDGATGLQEEAAALYPQASLIVGGQRILHLTGKTRMRDLAACGGADLLILNVEDEVGGRPCTVVDLTLLRQRGAMAGWIRNDRLELVSVSDASGARLWNDSDVRRAVEDGGWFSSFGSAPQAAPEP